MDLRVKLYLKRAENEFKFAKVAFKISKDANVKLSFNLDKEETFYSAVISHCYYAMFYCAKAILLTKGISAGPPDEHKKTLERFKRHFVDTGKLDRKLLAIYNEATIKANELLGLFKKEKRKRGQFTYKTITQANIEPAEESIANAKRFVAAIKHAIGD